MEIDVYDKIFKLLVTTLAWEIRIIQDTQIYQAGLTISQAKLKSSQMLICLHMKSCNIA